MTDATLLTDGGKVAVRLERRLADPPDVVWHALTEPEQLRAWFPTDVLVDGGEWVTGATLTFRFPPEMIDLTLTGKVLEVDPPHRLAFTWGEETLRFELAAEAEGTRLVLIDELPGSHAARNAVGWETCLDRLAGPEPPRGSWSARFQEYAVAFEPRVGPQEGPPQNSAAKDQETAGRIG